MNHWTDMFFVTRMTRNIILNYGNGKGVNKAIPNIMVQSAWYIVNRETGEITYSKSRQYPYSIRRDACRGAGKMFNHYMKSIEKSLLG